MPKAAPLDKAKWAAAMDNEPELCEYQQRFEAMKAALEEAQDRAVIPQLFLDRAQLLTKNVIPLLFVELILDP